MEFDLPKDKFLIKIGKIPPKMLEPPLLWNFPKFAVFILKAPIKNLLKNILQNSFINFHSSFQSVLGSYVFWTLIVTSSTTQPIVYPSESQNTLFLRHVSNGCIGWVAYLHSPSQNWPIRAKHRSQHSLNWRLTN